MAVVARTAFRALCRQIKRIDAERIPCTGVVGQSQYTRLLSPVQTLRDAYRAGKDQPGSLDSEFPPPTLTDRHWRSSLNPHRPEAQQPKL